MNDDIKKCCICGCKFKGWGNNPWPVVRDLDAYCCDECDAMYVLPARIAEICEHRKDNN